MIKVEKNGQQREIRNNQLQRHERNGWSKVETAVKATLSKPKQDTEQAPAVGTVPEQGDNNDNKGED